MRGAFNGLSSGIVIEDQVDRRGAIEIFFLQVATMKGHGISGPGSATVSGLFVPVVYPNCVTPSSRFFEIHPKSAAGIVYRDGLGDRGSRSVLVRNRQRNRVTAGGGIGCRRGLSGIGGAISEIPYITGYARTGSR